MLATGTTKVTFTFRRYFSSTVTTDSLRFLGHILGQIYGEKQAMFTHGTSYPNRIYIFEINRLLYTDS
jgi:hypothetical protein